MTESKRLPGRAVTRARRWAARLCLAESEAESRRVLARAFRDSGFDSLAAVERGADHKVSILWRSMDGREVSTDGPLGTADLAALAQFDAEVNRWAQQQDRVLSHADFLALDARTYSDFMPLPRVSGHAAWQTILSVPHRSNGSCFSIGAAGAASREACRKDIEIVRYLASLHLTLQNSGLDEAVRMQPEPPKLHPRQLECLRWAAAGKAYRDIADIVGISTRTVRFHLDSARTRYGYATITQAIVRAAKEFDFDPLDAR